MNEGLSWAEVLVFLCGALVPSISVSVSMCPCVCLAVWVWMAPFRVGVRPCGLHWLLWRGAEGPSWFRERSSLTGQGCLRACQPTWHTQTHIVWLRRFYNKNCWESNATLSAIKKIYFTVSVFWLWLLQGAVCMCVSAELAHRDKPNRQRNVKNTFGPPCLHEDSAAHRADRDSIISADLWTEFGEDRCLPLTELSNILECNMQERGEKKSLFVGSQVLALQIIHDHRSYWFSLVFLCLITHC